MWVRGFCSKIMIDLIVDCTILELVSFAEEELENKDGSIIGYTHKGGGIIVVLRTGGFLER